MATMAINLSKTSDLYLDENGFEIRGTCRVQTKCTNTDDRLQIARTGKCYIADNDGNEKHCRKNQLVCITGVSEEPEHAIRTTNGCWWSKTGMDDRWETIPTSVSAQVQIPDCTGFSKGGGKQPAFMNRSDQLITDATGKLAKSIVSNSSDALNVRNNIKCIAYVCVDQNNNAVNPAPDGTCDYNPNNDGGNTDNSVRKNHAQKYLNALSTL